MLTIYQSRDERGNLTLGTCVNGKYFPLGKVLPTNPSTIYLTGFDAFETLRRQNIVMRDLNAAGGFAATLTDPDAKFPLFEERT